MKRGLIPQAMNEPRVSGVKEDQPWALQANAMSHGFLAGLNTPESVLKTRRLIQEFLDNSDWRSDYIQDIDACCPQVLELLPDSVNISGLRIACRQYLKRVELHVRRAHGNPIPAHQDNFYHCIANGKGLKILIPLGKLEPKNGGLFYLDVKAGHEVEKHIPSEIENFSAGIDHFSLANVKKGRRSRAYTHKIGDASYHWLNSIHWANPNCTNTDALFLVFRLQDNESIEDKDMRRRYEECLAKHLERTSGNKAKGQ